MTEELKPCPFCGVLPLQYSTGEYRIETLYVITCDNEHCPAFEVSACAETEAGVIRRWNTRAPKEAAP